ncbi:hypothetical protein D3C73_761550 [compost metagenome]
MLKGPAALLIPSEKSIGECIGLRWGRLPSEPDNQHKARHPVQAPALAHTEERNQQQRPAQPVAGVFPVQFALFVTGGLKVLLGVQLDPVEVVVVEGQAAQRRIYRRG